MKQIYNENIIFGLSFKLTNYCNLSCPHCWINCGQKSPKKLLPIDTIRFYIDNWANDLLKIPNGRDFIENIPMTLTGGEIFETLDFAPDYLFKIVEIVNLYKIPLSLETNNTFIFDDNKTQMVGNLLKTIDTKKFIIKSSMDEFHTDGANNMDSVDAAARVACFFASDKILSEKAYWQNYIQKPTKDKTLAKMDSVFKSFGITDDLESGRYPPFAEFCFSHAKDDFCFNVCIDTNTRKQGRAEKNGFGTPVPLTKYPTLIEKLWCMYVSELWFNEDDIVGYNNFNPDQKTSLHVGNRFKSIKEIICELNSVQTR